MSFNSNTEKPTSASELTIDEDRKSQKSNVSKNSEEDESKSQESITNEEKVVKEKSISTVHNLEDYVHHSQEVVTLENFSLSTESLPTSRQRKSSPRFFLDEYKEDDHLPQVTAVKASEPSISSQSSSSSENVKSEEEINRPLYYEMYGKLKQQHENQKRKNNFLQKKLAEYYMKKKMYHVLLKDVREDSQKKYEEILDELESLNDSYAVEKQNVDYQEIALKNKTRLQEERVNGLLEKLLQSERDYSKQFTESDSVKQNRVDRYLRRQKNELLLVAKLRLQYVKGQNMFAEKEQQLNAIQNLGSNFHLMDYVQLKYDNRNLQDKLEEKEQELAKLRLKCKHLTQILAHRREKDAELDMSIKNLNEELEEIAGEYEDVREQLSYLKQERNLRRAEVEKLKADSGLLTQPMLQMDMQNAMEEVEKLTEKLKDIKNDYYQSSEQIVELRRKHSDTYSENSISKVASNETNASVKLGGPKNAKLEVY